MDISVLEKTSGMQSPLNFIVSVGDKEKIEFLPSERTPQKISIQIKKLNFEGIRFLAIKTTSFAKEIGAKEILLDMPPIENHFEIGKVLAGQFEYRSYLFEKFKSKKEEARIQKMTILVEEGINELRHGIQTGKLIAAYSLIARDWINSPGNQTTPAFFADEIVKLSEKNGLKTQVYEQEEMENMGMGCLLAVSQGTRQKPKMVVIEYNGSDSGEFYAIVGKGITFDSGGISLKPSAKMHEMKGDMAGGAAAACAINAIARLKLPINLVAVIPCVENMPGENAMRPGDVVLSMSGKTVEIINTDAEGRLIMADALSFVAEKKPKAIIDIATLTGSCIVALGYNTAGIMGNDDYLLEKIFHAGEKSGEKVWRFPLYEEFSDAMKSTIADLKNSEEESGGAGHLTAGAFLKEFVEDIPWVHIDMAGTFWTKDNRGFTLKGGTGWGVALLAEFFSSISQKDSL